MIRNVMARPTEDGKGMRARHTAEGRWVKTMVLTRPMRLAMEEATRLEADEMRFVTKKSVPSLPSASANFRLKKYVIHEAGTRPEAIESTANSRQSLTRMVRLS